MAEVPPLDKAWLAAHPLPAIASEGDKEERGLVLVAGGSPQTPGAVLLAGEAALRVGAGKLRIATVVEIAGLVAVALPEARVLDCLSHPELVPLEQISAGCAAVLIGPGLLDERLAEEVVGKVLASGAPALVLDAMALFAGRFERLRSHGQAAVLTPNFSEAASMLEVEQGEVNSDPAKAARELVRLSGAVVALKGPATVLLAPDGRAVTEQGGNVGMATSGSGDVLAGIVAGLLARGGDPFEAAAWAIHLHALAGDRLARKVGPVGYLARELCPEIPSLLRDLEQREG